MPWSAAKTGEDRDQRGTEAERDQRIDDFTRAAFVPQYRSQDVEVDGDAEQGEARNQHASDGARLEGDVETGCEAVRCRLGRAHIGADGDVHADEAGSPRQHGTDQEADGCGAGEKKPCGDENDGADDRDVQVLPSEVSLSTLANIACNFLHSGIALVRRQHRACRPDRVDHGQKSA